MREPKSWTPPGDAIIDDRVGRSSYDLPRSKRAVAVQRIHAGAILLLPTLAVVAAVLQTAGGATELWEPALALVFYLATMSGITVGFHRLFAHRSFRTGRALQALLGILGSMAAQGPLVYWVSNHRRHHHCSDKKGDPHSPHWSGERAQRGWSGFLHAHIGWTFTHSLTNSATFARDLLQDRGVGWINRNYYVWVILGLSVPAAVGLLLEGSLAGAWRGLLWGGGVRLFWSYHMTNSINSATHLFGYRSFATGEGSRNNVWLSLPTLGEAWHNNHHACQTSAIFGFSRWEIDIGGATIRLLQRLGLAWDVRTPNEHALRRIRGAG
jgi:stearoyl-CoA desaturase (delta-9 desaturase)